MQLLLGLLSNVVGKIHTSENLQIAQTQTSDEGGPILTVNQRNVIRFFAYKALKIALNKNDKVAAQAALEALKNPERFTLAPVSESPTPFRNSDGYSMSSAEVMATFEAIRLALEKVEKTVSLALLEEAIEVNSGSNILAQLRSEIQRLTSDGNTEGAASVSPLILDSKPEPPFSSEGDLAHPSPNPSLDTIVEPRIEKGVLARSLYALGARIVEYRKSQQRKLQEWLEKRQETKQQARQNRIQARQASNTGDFKSKDYSRGLPELHGPPTAKDTALYIAKIIAIPYALSTPCVGVCLALGGFYQTATLVDSVMGTIMLGGVMGGLVQLVTMPITWGACSQALVTYKKGQEALRNGEPFRYW